MTHPVQLTLCPNLSSSSSFVYVPNFTMMTTDTFSACWVILVFPESTKLGHGLRTGSLTCVCGLFACVYTQETSVYSLILWTFVEPALNLTLEKSQGGRAQSKLARNSHPSIWWPCMHARSCLTLSFGSEYSCSAPLTLILIVQELCESWGGHPGLSVLTSLLVSVDVKNY